MRDSKLSRVVLATMQALCSGLDSQNREAILAVSKDLAQAAPPARTIWLNPLQWAWNRCSVHLCQVGMRLGQR